MRTLLRRAFGRARRASPWHSDEPVREELFSVERLEEHARSLAAAQPVTPKPTKGHPLAGRLADNGAVLLRRLSRDRQRDRRAPRHHAGSGMAGRQLLSRRTADPRNPLRPAAGLLSATAKAGRRAVRRLSARVRPRLGLRRPHRQPLRPGDAVPLRARLSGRAAADDRRTLGGRDHAADRADRKPAPARRADRAQPRGAAGGGCVSPTACWAPAAAPPNRRRWCSPSHDGTTLPDAFAVQLVHRLRDQDPQDHPGADLARRSVWRRRARRPTRSCATSTSGRAPAPSRCATSSPACA